MQTTITAIGDFVRTVQVDKLEGQTDAWHVQFFSQLRTAKDPEARQRNFDLTLQSGQLFALRDALSRALSSEIAKESV